MRLILFCKLIIVSTILFWGIQRANAGQYDVVGAGCVPDPPSISGGLYSQVNAAIIFATGKTGTIVMHCPLINASTITTSDPTMSITYIDSSTSASNKIEFAIYSVKKSDGSLLTFLDYDTDQGLPCVQGDSSVHVCTATSLVPFDAANYNYIMEIYITRTSTAVNETFYAANVY